MDKLLKDIVLLAARRDKRAREAIRAYNKVKKMARLIQGFAGKLEKTAGGRK